MKILNKNKVIKELNIEVCGDLRTLQKNQRYNRVGFRRVP